MIKYTIYPLKKEYIKPEADVSVRNVGWELLAGSPITPDSGAGAGTGEYEKPGEGFESTSNDVSSSFFGDSETVDGGTQDTLSWGLNWPLLW